MVFFVRTKMLAEFGAFGAFVAGTLTGLQITIFLKQAGAESIPATSRETFDAEK